jgi:copper chaperone
MSKDTKGTNRAICMEQRLFKTTVNCSTCLRTVTPFLSEVPGIEHWEVDLRHPDRILKVQGTHLDISAIVAAVEAAGFEIEPLPQD